MLISGQDNKVTFSIDVMGTSSEPSVRLVIAANPELSFKAKNIGNSQWESNIALPNFIHAGNYDFRVEVVLNNRLFVPVNKQVEVTSIQKDLPEPGIQASPFEKSNSNVSDIAEPLPTLDFDIKVAESKKRIPIITAEDAKPVKPMLSRIAEATKAKVTHKLIKTDLPKPGSIISKPISINMKDIDSNSAKPKKLAESKVLPIQKTSNSLVRLIKESIIYE